MWIEICEQWNLAQSIKIDYNQNVHKEEFSSILDDWMSNNFYFGHSRIHKELLEPKEIWNELDTPLQPPLFNFSGLILYYFYFISTSLSQLWVANKLFFPFPVDSQAWHNGIQRDLKTTESGVFSYTLISDYNLPSPFYFTVNHSIEIYMAGA